MSNQQPSAVSPLAVSLAEKRFHEGLCLAAGGDFQAASAALAECVVAEPACSRYVQEFLTNLGRVKPVAAGTGSASAASYTNDRVLAHAAPAEVFKQGPRLLEECPRHVPTLLALAAACEANGYAQAETCYLRTAIEAAGDDAQTHAAQTHRRAAQRLAQLQNLDDAIACWRRVESIEPADEEAADSIVSLTIAKTRQRAGLLRTGEAPPVSPRARQRPSLSWPIYSLSRLLPESSGQGNVTLTMIQQLEATIRERSSIAEPYLRLAELYLEKDRDYDAERLLAKAREATDNDARIVQMWEEVSMIRHAHRVQLAEQESHSNPNAQTHEALTQTIKERARAELDIFRARLKRQPDSGVAHYEFGRRLLRTEKLHDASQHFAKAASDPEIRGPAALELGHCHEQLGDWAEALHQYRLAAETATSEQVEERKEALRRAAAIASRMKLKKLAHRYSHQP